MSNEEEPDYAEPQRQVQRWLGRNLLSLQQSERMLKALLVDSQVSVRMAATAGEQPHVTRTYEREKVAGMTLGGLVSLFCSDVVLSEGPRAPEKKEPEEAGNQIAFDTRFSFVLSKEVHAELEAFMREMVQTRNELVHHLNDRFELISLNGCTEALAYLQHCYERSERFRLRLQEIAEWMLETRQSLQQVFATKGFQKIVFKGKLPLQGSPMMDAMQVAFTACGRDDVGYVDLHAFTTWLEQHRPDESYEKYGRVSWAQLIHESGNYRIQRMDGEGNKIAARVVQRARQGVLPQLAP